MHEHVGGEVGVAGHQVRRRAGEGDVAPVGRDRGCIAGPGRRLAAVACHAHAFHRAAGTRPDEHVTAVVGVAWDEVGCGRGEADRSAIGTDPGCRPAAGVGGLDAAGRDADAGRLSGGEVALEHVGDAVGVAGHQVAGQRGEDDEAPVGADAGVGRGAICLPAGAERRAGGGAGGEVSDEHVTHAVRVAGHQVGRARDEGNQRAVGRDGDAILCRGLVGGHPAGRDRDQRRRHRRQRAAGSRRHQCHGKTTRKPTRRSTQAEPSYECNTSRASNPGGRHAEACAHPVQHRSGDADRGTPERVCSCHPPCEGYWVSSTVKAVLEVGSYGPGVPMLAELSRFTNVPFTCLPSLFEQ